MQRVLLVDRDPRSRLLWLDSVRQIVEVLVVQVDELPVRRVRSTRPAAVILSVGRGRVRETLGWSRVIKTDSSDPPAVAIHDPAGRIHDSDRALESSMADSIIRGSLSADQRRTFLEKILSGTADRSYTHPIHGWRQKLLENFR